MDLFLNLHFLCEVINKAGNVRLTLRGVRAAIVVA